MAFSPDDVRQATDDVLSSSEFQTDLPIADDASQEAFEINENERSSESTSWTRGSNRSRSDTPVPSASERTVSTFSSALFISVGIVALILIALWTFSSLRTRSRGAEQTQDETADKPAPDENGQTIPDDAESLAKQGLFGEAIHALLLNAMVQLHQRQSAIRKSFTSREVLRSARLGETAKQALAHLIQAVELAYFGGRETDSATYHACTRHYWAFDEENRAGVS